MLEQISGGDALDVFLIAGQSNASGYGNSAQSPKVPTGKVLQINSGVITDANDPVGAGANIALTGSAWPAFGLAYYNATKRKICFVPKGVPSSAQAAANDAGAGNWDVSGTLYASATSALDAALIALDIAGYTPRFCGVLWGQAENDALAGAQTALYQPALLIMLARLRASYGASMPFYIFEVGTDDPPTSGFPIVRAAQLAVAASDPHTRIIYRNAQDFITRGLMSGQYHYTQAGYNEMGTIGAVNVVSSQSAGGWERSSLDTNALYFNDSLTLIGGGSFNGVVGSGTPAAGTFTSVTINSYSAGTWTTPAYAGTDFTASSGTWTVDAGDVTTYSYTIVNKMMTVCINIDTSSVSATPATLIVKIPAGKTATKKAGNMATMSDDGAAFFAGFIGVAAGGTTIFFQKLSLANFATTTNTTIVGGQITFEIN